MAIELRACRAQPPAAARGAIDDLLGLQPQTEQRTLVLIHRRHDRLTHRQPLPLGPFALAALALFIELSLGLLERRATTLRSAQMLRQLIAARLTVELVLFTIDPLSVAEDLDRDPPVVDVRVARRVRHHLRAINRDHPHRHQPRLPAQLQHTAEQLRQRPLMPDAELRDRRMIRRPVRGDHPIRDVLHTRPLNPPRGPVPARIRIHQQPRPSSSGHTPAAPDHRRDTPHRTPKDQAHQPSPAPSTPDGPDRSTPTTTAASGTTGHDHNR